MGVMAVLGSVSLGGCYQFVRVDPVTAPAGSRVRAELSRSGVEELAGLLGSVRGNRLQGRLVEVSPDGALLLEVARAAGATPVGVTARSLYSRVRLGPENLLQLEVKTLDRTRTVLLVGGGAILGGALVAIAFDTYGGGSEGQGPPVDEAIIPIFTIRW